MLRAFSVSLCLAALAAPACDDASRADRAEARAEDASNEFGERLAAGEIAPDELGNELKRLALGGAGGVLLVSVVGMYWTRLISGLKAIPGIWTYVRTTAIGTVERIQRAKQREICVPPLLVLASD